MNSEAFRQLMLLGKKDKRFQPLLPVLEQAVQLLIDSFDQGGRLFLCGNGGSAADCEHIAGELLKGFQRNRPIAEADRKGVLARISRKDPFRDDSAYLENIEYMLKKLQQGLPAIPLVSQAAINSAIANDLGADYVYAQQVLALGRPPDILLGISTSGQARNVILAVQLARGLGMKTIALTGGGGGELVLEADIALCVPAETTAEVQELHLPLYHVLCAALETHYYA